ncbi:MAG TPA: FtsX-like permease family protein, partial [Leptospiraceae bacterium]|nr:FtsX-like permease family protein [Leptospiraceae bacterium]
DEIILSLKQTRRSRGKFLFSAMAIVLGVAAISAVRSFSSSLENAVSLESRKLMGADMRLEAGSSIPQNGMTAELLGAGARAADVIEFNTMLRVEKPKPSVPLSTRLVRVRAIASEYPFFGRITSEPESGFARVREGRLPVVLVDSTLLPALGLVEGDSVFLGKQKFRVAGVLRREPGSPGFSAGIGAPVYIHVSFAEKTGLLVTGSRIRYARYFKLPDFFPVEEWKEKHWQEALNANITIYTYNEAASGVRRFMDNLTRFMTLAGLVILLLGGLGIGLAMNVFVRSRMDDIAVMRALGATPGGTMRVFFILGFLTALVGSVLGYAIGFFGARAGADFGAAYLPVEVHVRFDALSALLSILPGILFTMAFVLFPVFEIRRISPLRVLRRQAEDQTEDGPGLRGFVSKVIRLKYEIISAVVLASVITGVSAGQSESIAVGAFFTSGVALAVAVLYLLSLGLIRLSRLVMPWIGSYRIRQGIANLHRPGNQTSVMLTSAGVGALLIVSLYTVQATLQREMRFDGGGRPNLYIMDVQPDQREGVEAVVHRYAASSQLVPMVSMRVKAINGEKIDRSNIEKNANRRNWENSLRSYEYFASYRDHLNTSEKLARGSFWGTRRPENQEVSVDERWADRLGIRMGDLLEFDIGGAPFEATVTSMRNVDWAAMQINSILLFSPGAIEEAPHIFVSSLSVPAEKDRFRFQEELVNRYPNISVIDVNQVVETIGGIAENVALVVRSIAFSTLIAGLIILTGAIGAGRFARVRESALFKTIGARSRDIRVILSTEYALLGFLGALAGSVLSQAVSWPLLYYLFDLRAAVPLDAIVAMSVSTGLISTLVGMLISRGVAASSPLEVLREETV